MAVRKNRKRNPKDVIMKKLTRGGTIWRRKGRVVVGKWHDKRDVLMISTCHKFSMDETTNRKGTKLLKPNIVADYNKHQSGIDQADQMLSYYTTQRKTIRWYLKLFFHVLDISIWNSKWIYDKIATKKISYLDFRSIATF